MNFCVTGSSALTVEKISPCTFIKDITRSWFEQPKQSRAVVVDNCPLVIANAFYLPWFMFLQARLTS